MRDKNWCFTSLHYIGAISVCIFPMEIGEVDFVLVWKFLFMWGDLKAKFYCLLAWSLVSTYPPLAYKMIWLILIKYHLKQSLLQCFVIMNWFDFSLVLQIQGQCYIVCKQYGLYQSICHKNKKNNWHAYGM